MHPAGGDGGLSARSAPSSLATCRGRGRQGRVERVAEALKCSTRTGDESRPAPPFGPAASGAAGPVTIRPPVDPDLPRRPSASSARSIAPAPTSLEIGVPFSIRWLDGPVIQRATERALAAAPPWPRSIWSAGPRPDAAAPSRRFQLRRTRFSASAPRCLPIGLPLPGSTACPVRSADRGSRRVSRPVQTLGQS